MKSIITTFALAFTILTGSANAVELVIPSREGGGIHTLSKHITAELGKAGVPVNMDVMGNCVKGMAKFRSTDKPSIYVASSAKNSSHTARKGCGFTESQFNAEYVSPAFMATMALCAPNTTTSFADLKDQSWKTYTIGTDSSRAWAAKTNMEATGLKVKTVNYKNSKSAMAGMLAGDFDLFWSNAKVAPKVQDAGGQCLLVTDVNGMNGIPSMKEVTGVDPIGGSNIYWIAARNFDAASLASLKTNIENAVTNASSQEFATKKWFFTINGKENLKSEAKDYVTVFTVDR